MIDLVSNHYHSTHSDPQTSSSIRHYPSSPSPTTFASPRLSKSCTSLSLFFFNNNLVPSSSKPITIQLPTKRGFHTTGFRCNSSFFPGEPPSGDGDSSSKNVLDAFFLGKALAETPNERIESTVGEFLSNVGRLQAEQQRQVQEFQEEVLDRAKKQRKKQRVKIPRHNHRVWFSRL
ncbi:hypothetical protein RYX36_001256 [Vicia faba]